MKGKVVTFIMWLGGLILFNLLSFGIGVPSLMGASLDFLVILGYFLIVASVVIDVTVIWGMVSFVIKAIGGIE